MRGEAHQGQAEGVSLALVLLKGGVGLVLHLDMEDFDTLESQVGCPADALGNANGLATKLPERVGRHADVVAVSGCRLIAVRQRAAVPGWAALVVRCDRPCNGGLLQKCTSARIHGLVPQMFFPRSRDCGPELDYRPTGRVSIPQSTRAGGLRPKLAVSKGELEWLPAQSTARAGAGPECSEEKRKDCQSLRRMPSRLTSLQSPEE